MARARFQINPNAYNVGAVRFQMPHNQYMNQMLLHQLSKQEAMGQYYDKLLTNINPAGVRAIDLPGWQKKANDWQEFGINNRSKLINPRLDGGAAQRQFMSMHTDLLSDLDKSKRAGQSESEVRSVFLDPNKRKLATDQDMVVSHNLSRSIYDPQHYKDNAGTEYTPADFSYNAPPFDIKKQGDIMKYATRGLKPEKVLDVKNKHVESENGVPQRVVIPWSTKFNQDALNQIGQRVGSAYDQDKGMQAYFDNAIHDEDTYNRLNQSGKAVFGNGFEIGTDPRKAAVAWGIANNSATNQGQDTWPYKNPPRPRQPTQREQQQQDMMNWIRGMHGAIQNGDVNEMKRFGGVLYSGNGKRQYQDIDPYDINISGTQGSGDIGSYSKQLRKGATISSVESQWVPDDASNPSGPGSKKDVLVKTQLDPSDPNLDNKLGNIYQMHMGSTPGMERLLLNNTVKPGSSPPANNDNPLNLNFK